MTFVFNDLLRPDIDLVLAEYDFHAHAKASLDISEYLAEFELTNDLNFQKLSMN